MSHLLDSQIWNKKRPSRIYDFVLHSNLSPQKIGYTWRIFLKRFIVKLGRRRKSSSTDGKEYSNESGFLNTKAKPSVYHAVVVIFLEFFAWGLLTTPVIEVLRVSLMIQNFRIQTMNLSIICIYINLEHVWKTYISDQWTRSRHQRPSFIFICTTSWGIEVRFIPFFEIESKDSKVECIFN